jgi:hypothetical protein
MLHKLMLWIASTPGYNPTANSQPVIVFHLNNKEAFSYEKIFFLYNDYVV